MTNPVRWLGMLAGVALAYVAAALPGLFRAGAGAWLVRRLVGFPSPLIHGRDIIRFMIAAGPLASLVSATLTLTLLCLSSARPWSHFGAHWINAWLGDTLGVLLVSAVA